MNRSKGFTLIELLTVIAIISVLAAITFPVFARAKVQAFRSSDMSNMNAIRSALQLYRADQGAYPPALLGYATQYAGGPNPTVDDVVPADQVKGPLYPRRIDSLEVLRPAQDRPTGPGAANQQIARAVWPTGQTSGSAGTPQQRYGPNDGWVKRCVRPGDGSAPFVADNYYYAISGYDAAPVPVPGGGFRNELRYTLFWTGYTVPADPCNPDPVTESGSASDDPRQLGYSDPPETTVVTWNSYYRELQNGLPRRGKQDIVLFLGGGARPFDSAEVYDKAWAVRP